MADDKQGREEQADNEEKRQRKRMQEEAQTRADEPEPVHEEPDDHLGELDDALESHDYPADTEELVETYGDYEVETRDGSESLEDVLDESEGRTYESADDARSRILGLLRR